MKKIRIFVFITVYLVCYSQCSFEETDTAKSYYSGIEINSKENVIIDQLEFDSIIVNDIPSSFIGYLRVFYDTIYFVDYMTCRIFPLDISGSVHDFHLGSGKGPNEYPGGIIYDFVKTPDGNHVLLGTSWDVYIYDQNWKIKQQQRIDWKIIHSRKEMLHNPKPSMTGLYSFTHNTGRDKGRLKGDYIYYEISSQHPTFNMINSREYYREGRIIAKLNYKTAVIEEILGIRSLAYEDYEYIGHFSFCSYDINLENKSFYLSFQPDHLIYVCDNNFLPHRAFGQKGRNMNTNYTEYAGNDPNPVGSIYDREKVQCGYYESIEFIKERNLLFRSYTQGSHSDYDGLQIYHNKILIADIDVPKGFKVKGYIEPYFVSNIFLDFENEIGVIYKFKIKY